MCKINQLKLTVRGLLDQLSSKRCIFPSCMHGWAGQCSVTGTHRAAALALHCLVSWWSSPHLYLPKWLRHLCCSSRGLAGVTQPAGDVLPSSSPSPPCLLSSQEPRMPWIRPGSHSSLPRRHPRSPLRCPPPDRLPSPCRARIWPLQAPAAAVLHRAPYPRPIPQQIAASCKRDGGGFDRPRHRD